MLPSWKPKTQESEGGTAVAEPEPESTEQREYVVKFKRGIRGLEQSLVRARNLEWAERVGRKWCEKQAGAGPGVNVRFICVEDPVLADESILA